MRTLTALCCVIAFAACGLEDARDVRDVVDESTLVTESSTAVLVAPDPMTMVGGCRERPRSTMSRALHDAAEVFSLSRETRHSLAALVPEPIAHQIWR